MVLGLPANSEGVGMSRGSMLELLQGVQGLGFRA